MKIRPPVEAIRSWLRIVPPSLSFPLEHGDAKWLVEQHDRQIAALRLAERALRGYQHGDAPPGSAMAAADACGAAISEALHA